MSKHPLRVTHVTEAPLGGVISYLHEVLAYQAHQDLEAVHVITPEINLDALRAKTTSKVHFVPFSHRRGSGWSLMLLGWLTVKHVWAVRPDILHVHSTFAGVIVRACLILKPSRTKIVYCPHGWAFSREARAALNRVVAFAERLLSFRSDAIICISDYEKREALRVGISPQRCVVIDNGVSPHASAQEAPQRREPDSFKVIAFAGRFDRQKGFDVFVEVMRRLGSEARGIAIGSSIVSDKTEFNIPDNLEILGWRPRDEVFRVYTKADLLIVPSRWEGFGLVAIEAMQARLPVFASRVGGLQDIVVDGATGRLFEPNDLEGIVKLIRTTDIPTLRAYGMQGYERYRQCYTAALMNDRIMELYRNLVQESRVGAPGRR